MKSTVNARGIHRMATATTVDQGASIPIVRTGAIAVTVDLEWRRPAPLDPRRDHRSCWATCAPTIQSRATIYRMATATTVAWDQNTRCVFLAPIARIAGDVQSHRLRRLHRRSLLPKARLAMTIPSNAAILAMATATTAAPAQSTVHALWEVTAPTAAHVRCRLLRRHPMLQLSHAGKPARTAVMAIVTMAGQGASITPVTMEAIAATVAHVLL